jgi:hypothetical protein
MVQTRESLGVDGFLWPEPCLSTALARSASNMPSFGTCLILEFALKCVRRSHLTQGVLVAVIWLRSVGAGA